MRAGSTSGRDLQVEPGAQHVRELAGSVRAVVERLAELHPVPGAAPVVHGQHDVAAAGQVLVHRVGVVVVGQVVEAQQHLPARSAVEEHDRGPPLVGARAAGLEELGGDRHAVARGERHRLGVHQGRFREARGDGAGRQLAARGLAARLDRRVRGTPGRGAQEGERPVAGHDRIPLDSLAGRQRGRDVRPPSPPPRCGAGRRRPRSSCRGRSCGRERGRRTRPRTAPLVSATGAPPVAATA